MSDSQLCKEGIKIAAKKTYIYRRNVKAAAKSAAVFFEKFTKKTHFVS